MQCIYRTFLQNVYETVGAFKIAHFFFLQYSYSLALTCVAVNSIKLEVKDKLDLLRSHIKSTKLCVYSNILQVWLVYILWVINKE